MSIMSNLQPNCRLRLYLERMAKYTGGKRFIHGTKPHKDNPSQIPIYCPSQDYEYDAKEFHGNRFKLILSFCFPKQLLAIKVKKTT